MEIWRDEIPCTHPVCHGLLRRSDDCGGGVTPAHAACSSGAQCEVNGFGDTENPANDSFQSIGANPENAALKAINGGAITGSALTIDATGGVDHYGVYVDTGGQITLTGDTTTITGATGVRAQDTGSAFAMTGGKITASDLAVDIQGNGSSVTLTNVAVEDNSGTASAVRFDSLAGNASFSMTGGSITSLSGALTIAGNGHQATLSGVAINAAGGILMATNFGADNTLTLNGGTTLTYSGGSNAIQVQRGQLFIDDAHITSDGYGIQAHGAAGGLVSVDARNFSIQTSATPPPAHGIHIDNYAVVKLANGSITTHGLNARGIRVASNQSDALIADALTITTHGDLADAILAWNSTTTLTNSQLIVHGVGAAGLSANGLGDPNRQPIINMTGGSIVADGTNARGAVAERGGEVNLDGVAVTTAHSGSTGLLAVGSATASFKNGTIDSQGVGVAAQTTGTVAVAQSVITAAGANGVGLRFNGSTGNNLISLDASTVTATGTNALAVQALGSSDNQLNANNSVLRGHAAVAATATLRMNLTNNTAWTLTPSAGGVTRSDVTFLSLNNSRVIFDPASAQRQTLVVGMGDASGSPVVYQASGSARIEMNTVLNAGGALANQTTDRVVINGNASGTTLLAVNALAGSVGADTGGGASAGISLVQVYGNATSNSFALTGGYVPIGAYEYQLYAFDPGSSDPAQRDPTANLAGPFWDFRLLSGAGGGKTPLAQIPSYLVAPNALFQARLLDIATLHQRVGAVLPADKGNRDFFLRTYGGDYRYHGNRSVSQYGFNADTRYHAVQGGGNFYGVDSANASLRFGIAASVGDVSFTPNRANHARKTRMDVWSISPTFTWQHADGAYVDALVSTGQFKGDIANRNGVTTTLEGQSHAASIEVGVPFPLAGVTLEPQLQTVYQRLKFDSTRDADGVAVQLGTLSQWTVRTGAKVGTVFDTPAGGSIQFYGKAHVAHHFGDGRKVRLSDRFRVGKSGTVLETGLGIAATFAQGHATVYADVTRQTRIGRAGQEGWSSNLGARVRF